MQKDGHFPPQKGGWILLNGNLASFWHIAEFIFSHLPILNILSSLHPFHWLSLSMSVLFSFCFIQRGALHQSMKPKQRDKWATRDPFQCLSFLWSLTQYICLPNSGYYFQKKIDYAATGLGVCPWGGHINAYYSYLMSPLLISSSERVYDLCLYLLSMSEYLIQNRYSVDFVELNCKSMKKKIPSSIEKVGIMASRVRMGQGQFLNTELWEKVTYTGDWCVQCEWVSGKPSKQETDPQGLWSSP